jgi:uncharacterized protein (TIGR03905 family)
MKHYEFIPSGVCCQKIEFDLTEEKTIQNLKFIGGCRGNLNAISALLENVNIEYIIKKLKNNPCGSKKTSCTDQLAIVLEEIQKTITV